MHSLSRLPLLPRRNSGGRGTGLTHPGQITSQALSSQVFRPSSVEVVPATDRPLPEKKTSVYAEVVRNLNDARQSGLPFRVCALLHMTFKY